MPRVVNSLNPKRVERTSQTRPCASFSVVSSSRSGNCLGPQRIGFIQRTRTPSANGGSTSRPCRRTRCETEQPAGTSVVTVIVRPVTDVSTKGRFTSARAGRASRDGSVKLTGPPGSRQSW